MYVSLPTGLRNYSLRLHATAALQVYASSRCSVYLQGRCSGRTSSTNRPSYTTGRYCRSVRFHSFCPAIQISQISFPMADDVRGVCVSSLYLPPAPIFLFAALALFPAPLPTCLPPLPPDAPLLSMRRSVSSTVRNNQSPHLDLLEPLRFESGATW